MLKTAESRPAAPLGAFYARARMRPPKLESLPGRGVPQPYRGLLVHAGDMTPALERFHHSSIHLEVIERRRVGNRYSRKVILRLDGSGKPVEFGAIDIFLGGFADPARRLILEERRPLGTILREQAIPHASRPSAYFRIRADRMIRKALGLKGPDLLYGRRNTLSDAAGGVLAEIVEILPPA